MIVELVGLPGSGKTTFAKRLSEREGWSVVSIAFRSELVFYNALFFFQHPVDFLRGLLWLCRYCGFWKLWYTKFTNLFLVHNATYMKARKYPRAIIDQGHHQNVISLFDRIVADDVIDRYVRFLPKPDILCFFIADDETRTKRLAERGYGARGELDENYREAWEEARSIHFEHFYVSRATLPCVTETVSPKDSEQKQKKIEHARQFLFVLHGRMPTEKAHGLQIAKTMEALTVKGGYAALWVPHHKNPIAVSVGEYYGLNPIFPVRTFFAPDFLRLPKFLGSFRFWIDALGFFLTLAFTRIPHDGVFFTRNPELAWLFKLKGAFVWYEAHLFPSSKSWLLKFFLGHVDGIIANSKGTADAFLANDFKNIHVVRNGVDPERFIGAPRQEDARLLLGLPQGKMVVMYVGAFYAWKGVPFLLETWRKNFSARDDLILVLVGGTEDDLKKYGGIGAYREAKNILFIPHAPAVKVPMYLSAANILVLPNMPMTDESVRYTSPIKLFEYMASGRPIVAADLPSIREIISEETGVFFRAGNSDALAEKITMALCSSDDAKLRGSRARALVHRYSWDARAQLLMNIVRGCPRRSASALAQFLKTLLAGGFVAVLQLFLVYVFTEYFVIWYVFSVVLAYACALLANFLFLKLIFVGGTRKNSNEFSRYALLVAGNLFVNTIATYVLVEKLQLWYMLAQFFMIGTLTIANFFIYRAYVFQRKE
ncbi:MAG: glycosyltransferase [Patescibacteria group bacterium]